MPYFMTTDLGREVPLNDWVGFHRDRVLSVLYQMYQQGVPNPGLKLSMVAGITGLKGPEAHDLAQVMLKLGLLFDDGDTYRLTLAGIQWVQESPTP